MKNIKIRLFLSEKAFCTSNTEHDYTELLGLWYDVFPFSLADIGGTIEANTVAPRNGQNLSLPPFVASKKSVQLACAAIKEDVKKHNSNVKAHQNELSLVSSSGLDYVGGVCHNTTSDLAGVLKRYYRDTFASVVCRDWGDCINAYVDKSLGVISRHRRMRRAYESEINVTRHWDPLDCILDDAETLTGCNFLRWSQKMIGIKDFMSHIENLGHAEAGYVEGLNVELLAFQRQSVQWALERENLPGGIQSLFWPKIPGCDIYYNPILRKFRSTKPRVSRGGFIAEEMGKGNLLAMHLRCFQFNRLRLIASSGLGKTVISLALILQNPAPAAPVSGSHIASLARASSSRESDSVSKWETDLYDQTPGLNPKQGSIVSRGTLVICPVSLVGQWIEEAKNKLTNPGLVYPYHGQNRKRDANILAKKNIVVTTYQVLSSDKT